MIRTISIKNIVADPEQPRKNKPAQYIEELGKSIATLGLKNPIRVRKDPDHKGKFIVVNGECRFLAHCKNKKLAKVGTIACMIDQAAIDKGQRFLEQLQDNDVRLNMSPSETIQAYAHCVELGVDIPKLASALGKAPAVIKRDIEIAALPKPVLLALDKRQITKEVAAFLLKFNTEVQQLRALGKAVKAKSTKQAIANLTAYEAAVKQTSLSIVLAGKADNEDLKAAGRRLEKFLNQVGTFSQFAEKSLTLSVRAKARELEKLEHASKLLRKLAENLEKTSSEYRAVANK